MKPSLPQGTRDFGSDIVRKRQYIFNIIRSEFELFGFQPLETPAFENLETLMGKYGDEGDKLIFKILNNGLERKEKHEQARHDLESVLHGKSVKGLTERALKYDLTIPFARYVAMNHGQLSFPYKRYQIQPVWRADKPQRGRYREFYQCDADVVGSASLLNEVELISLYTSVFAKLGIEVSICLNNRKILAALAELCGGADVLIPITVAIDKLDKIGLEKVMDELKMRELPESALQQIQHYLNLSQMNASTQELLSALKKMFEFVTQGTEGVAELEYILSFHPHLKLDVTLARGLNYYTGSIFEVKPLNIQMGSIGGGGRYDDLTGLFDVPNVPGVGISFGVDRIYDVMEEKGLFPEEITQGGVQVMLVNFGAEFEKRNLEIMQFLRERQVSCELYPEAVKFDKQLKYANKRSVNFVILIGEDELQSGMLSIKNFQTKEQVKVTLEECLHIVR
jgi:histidyl-tRNA synthetase